MEWIKNLQKKKFSPFFLVEVSAIKQKKKKKKRNGFDLDFVNIKEWFKMN